MNWGTIAGWKARQVEQHGSCWYKPFQYSPRTPWLVVDGSYHVLYTSSTNDSHGLQEAAAEAERLNADRATWKDPS